MSDSDSSPPRQRTRRTKRNQAPIKPAENDDQEEVEVESIRDLSISSRRSTRTSTSSRRRARQVEEEEDEEEESILESTTRSNGRNGSSRRGGVDREESSTSSSIASPAASGKDSLSVTFESLLHSLYSHSTTHEELDQSLLMKALKLATQTVNQQQMWYCTCDRTGGMREELQQVQQQQQQQLASSSSYLSAPPSRASTPLRNHGGNSANHSRNSSSLTSSPTPSLSPSPSPSPSPAVSLPPGVTPALCVLCQKEVDDEANNAVDEEHADGDDTAIATLTCGRIVSSFVTHFLESRTRQSVTRTLMRASDTDETLTEQIVEMTSSYYFGTTTSSSTTSSSSSRPHARHSSSSRSSSAQLGSHFITHLFLLSLRWCSSTTSIHRSIQGLKLLLVLLRKTRGFLVTSERLVTMLDSICEVVIDVTTRWIAGGASSSPSSSSSSTTASSSSSATENGADDNSTVASSSSNGTANTSSNSTDNLFRYLLSIYTHLFSHFTPYTSSIHLLLQSLWIPSLESTWLNLSQKRSVLEMFRYIFRTPKSLMNTFVNADMQSCETHVVEKMVATLTRMIEGSVEGMTSLVSAASTASSSSSSSSTSSISTDTPHSVLLLALKLLIHLLHLQVQWVGVPGIKRPDDIGQSVPRPLVNAKTNKHEWQPLWQQHQREQQISDQSLQLARGGKIKAALRYLQQMKPCAGGIEEMARYLFETEGLTPSDLGDFLANPDDDFLTSKQYKQLRKRYVSYLSFHGLKFSDALRVFLCDSGFRLPGEAQKIDRLLSTFCDIYCVQNEGKFRNSSSAFIVCFALVMLNTDLHDPRLKSGKSSRKPMSINEFIKNLRGVDDGHDFPREWLVEMYEDIKAKSIEWKEEVKKAGTNGNEDQEEDGSESTNSFGSGFTSLSSLAGTSGLTRDTAKHMLALGFSTLSSSASNSTRRLRHTESLRRTASSLRRRLMSQLTHSSFSPRKTWTIPNRAWLVAPLFDITWYRVLATLSFTLDQSPSGTSTSRFDYINLCMDGLVYCATLSYTIGAHTEYQAFLNKLARMIYSEHARMNWRKNVTWKECVAKGRVVHGSSNGTNISSTMNGTTTMLSKLHSAASSTRSLHAPLSTSASSSSLLSTNTNPNSNDSPDNPESRFDSASAWATFDEDLSRQVAKRMHLKQAWCIKLSMNNTTEGGSPTTLATDTLCKTLLSHCSSMKHRLSSERRFIRLLELQDYFGSSEVLLSYPGREVIKEGVLKKVKQSEVTREMEAEVAAATGETVDESPGSNDASSASSAASRLFHVVLCTDILFYSRLSKRNPTQPARDGFRSAYHLALMEKVKEVVRNVVNTNGGGGGMNGSATSAAHLNGTLTQQQQVTYSILLHTPQSPSPLRFVSLSQHEAYEWLTAINTQIDLLRMRLHAARSMMQSAGPESRRMALFVTSSHAMLYDACDEDEDEDESHVGPTVASITRSSTASDLSTSADSIFPSGAYCRLCMRAYHTLFRRLVSCEWCGCRVCSECAQAKVRLPPSMRSQLLPPPLAPGQQRHLVDSDIDSAPSSAPESPKTSSSRTLLSASSTMTSSFFTKAQASMTSMRGKLMEVVSKLDTEKDGSTKLTVCDACQMTLIQEIEAKEQQQQEQQPSTSDLTKR